MSLLSIAPDIVSAASGNLQNLGSALRSANAAAASQTTAVAAPAADEVSAAITGLFGTHAQEFQALSAKAATFHDEITNLLNGGAAQYVSAELTNAQQTLANAVNGPAEALLGHPLIGTGGAAAANPAVTVTPTPGSLGGINFALGPFGFSANFNQVSFTGGGFALTGNVAVNLNTLFGSATLAGGNATVGILSDGTFVGNILETTPIGFVTVDALGNFATGSPIPTYLAYNFNGLQVAWPGTTVPILPNVSYNPTP